MLASLLANTIDENWGITFNATAIVDFAGSPKSFTWSAGR
jgi:hypothetical protein